MGVSATLERYEDMVSLVDEIGFLPLFRHPIPGFSVADLTPAANWFDGEAHDPWEWREWAAQSGALAYGKFFRNKTGFISKRFLPLFANARRDGYDFDALYDDGKAPRAHKRLMDLFLAPSPAVIPSHELKARAGFSQKGGGSLDSALTQLQMQTYLCICGFTKKRNRHGKPYGWAVAQYTTPEHLFGAAHVQSAYDEAPADSFDAIIAQAARFYPDAAQATLQKALR
jgi:hypothetical protein